MNLSKKYIILNILLVFIAFNFSGAQVKLTKDIVDDFTGEVKKLPNGISLERAKAKMKSILLHIGRATIIGLF